MENKTSSSEQQSVKVVAEIHVASKPFYKRFWFWVLAIVVLVIATSGAHDKGRDARLQKEAQAESAAPKKDWVVVKEVTASGMKNTEDFQLLGGQQRLSYSQTNGLGAMCAIYLESSGHDITTQGGIPVAMLTTDAKADNTILRKSSGSYYLSFNAANTKCTGKLEELR